MKNIYLLQTDKASSLTKRCKTNKLMWSYKGFAKNHKFGDVIINQNQHLYITSDEEIKEGDWFIRGNGNYGVRLCTISTKTDIWDKTGQYSKNSNEMWKVILTTDGDLMKDGIQAIDNEFLEWFVKNPSCEEVEIKRNFADEGVKGITYYGKYFLTIPTEELKRGIVISHVNKQETLEDLCNKVNFINPRERVAYYNGLKNGAEWQQKRICNEENVGNLLNWLNDGISIRHSLPTKEELMDWFKQFKKK